MYRSVFIKPQGGIGDFVIVIPLLHALRARLPSARLVLGASALQADLAGLLCESALDSVLLLPDRRRMAAPLATARAAWSVRADLIVDLSVVTYTPIWGIAGRPCVVGCSREDVDPFVGWLPRKRLAPSPSPHRVDRCLQVLPFLGARVGRISFEFPQDDGLPAPLRERLRRADIAGPGVVALVPHSEVPAKSWSADCLRRTIDAMVDDLRLRIVIVGAAVREHIQRPGVLDLRGHTSVVESAHLLRYSGLFEVTVGVDTGMMHLAGSISSDADGDYASLVTGNRTLSLFGPTDPSRFRPYDPTGRFNTVIQAPRDGQPYNRYGKTPGRSCSLSALTPEMILEPLERVLRDARSPDRRRER